MACREGESIKRLLAVSFKGRAVLACACGATSVRSAADPGSSPTFPHPLFPSSQHTSETVSNIRVRKPPLSCLSFGEHGQLLHPIRQCSLSRPFSHFLHKLLRSPTRQPRIDPRRRRLQNPSIPTTSTSLR